MWLDRGLSNLNPVFVSIFVKMVYTCQVNFYGLTPVAFAATGFACPPSVDNFIYGFHP
jgi:hypothetical protein